MIEDLNYIIADHAGIPNKKSVQPLAKKLLAGSKNVWPYALQQLHY
jgi:hypothetical protein